MAAALIAAFACPSQPAVLVDRRPGEVRTSVVACDGDRRVVLRRARLKRRGTGTRIVAVAGAGPWVAWAELRWARGLVWPTVMRTRIGARRREISGGLGRRKPPRFELVVTSRGGVAWLMGRQLATNRGVGGSRLISSFAAFGPLVLEDDRTVRWREPGGRLGFADLHSSPCAPRPGYRVVGEDERMLVTETLYGTLRVLRACGRDDRDDPVIVQVPVTDRLELVGLDAPWALFAHAVPGACTAEVYHSGFGDGRTQPVPCERAPAAGRPFAVSDSGIPAWILDGPDGSALLMPLDGRMVELDATAPGGLAGLTSEGDALRWLHEGQPRSVVFHP